MIGVTIGLGVKRFNSPFLATSRLTAAISLFLIARHRQPSRLRGSGGLAEFEPAGDVAERAEYVDAAARVKIQSTLAVGGRLWAESGQGPKRSTLLGF
jgi:hypothetical protein